DEPALEPQIGNSRRLPDFDRSIALENAFDFVESKLSNRVARFPIDRDHRNRPVALGADELTVNGYRIVVVATNDKPVERLAADASHYSCIQRHKFSKKVIETGTIGLRSHDAPQFTWI